MSPTKLVLRALKVPPRGSPSTRPGVCAFCGDPIAVGDLCGPFAVSSGFMDGRTVQPDSNTDALLCGACIPFTTKTLMFATQRILATEEAVYPIGRGDARAWFLLNPPKTPFVVCMADSKLQHLLWRVPISHDPDHWYVQLGYRTIHVNRRRVLAAAEAAQRLTAATIAVRKIKKLASPFVSLDPELGDLATGRIREDVRAAGTKTGLSADLELLEALGPGELWAIGALLFRSENISCPEPVDLTAKTASPDQASATEDS